VLAAVPTAAPAAEPDSTADALLPTLRAPARARSGPGFTAPPDVLAALREGSVDLRALAVLAALTSERAVPPAPVALHGADIDHPVTAPFGT
jgi:hypothetical protein